MMTAIILVLGAIIAGLILYRIFSKKTANQQLAEVFVTNLTAQEFVEKYNKKQGQVIGGSMCFYGHWFGRPYDNYHQLELVTYNDTTNTLTLDFVEKETLIIRNPKDIAEFKNKLVISSADMIYWKWFSYGESQTDESLCFIQVERKENLLIGSSNVDRYKPDFKDLNIINPAVLWI